jgi:hypothetical protein
MLVGKRRQRIRIEPDLDRVGGEVPAVPFEALGRRDEDAGGGDLAREPLVVADRPGGAPLRREGDADGVAGRAGLPFAGQHPAIFGHDAIGSETLEIHAGLPRSVWCPRRN